MSKEVEKQVTEKKNSSKEHLADMVSDTPLQPPSLDARSPEERNASEFYPLFMEEVFIVNMYGTDSEAKRFYELMQNTAALENIVEMAALIEDIKRRALTKMNWYCCHRCERYQTCRINWYRGERNIERNCCSYCSNYEKCLAEMKRRGEQKQ